MNNDSEMPTHCCVPLCTKKGYQDEVTGAKISYFRLPTKENQRKQWIQAIRRDLGKKFSTSNSTKVCSRHFKDEDFKITLTHVVSLKPGVVPSVFAWKRSSPRKRPLPAPRLTNKKEILIEKATERNSANCRNFCRNFKSDIFIFIDNNDRFRTSSDRSRLLFPRVSIRGGCQKFMNWTRLLHCYPRTRNWRKRFRCWKKIAVI